MKTVNPFLAITAGALLVLLDLYRAHHLSFTHDEGYSFLQYVPMDFMDIVSYKDNFTNNHIINSLLMKLFHFITGPSELSMRMPNILAHVLYLVFTYKMASRFCGKYCLAVFLLLNANPYFLEFFSIARGYGLAFGFLSGGLYFYCCYLEKERQRDHVLSLVFFALAALANFALLQLYFSVLLLHNLFRFAVKKDPFSFRSAYQANKVNLIVTALFGVILYEPVRKIIKYNAIDFGGKAGFWENTVGSLLNGSALQSSYSSGFILAGKIFILMITTLFFYRCIAVLRGNRPVELPQKLMLFCGLLLFLVPLSSVLQHWLMGTPFMEHRFALFLFPLFAWTCVFLFAELDETRLRPVTGLVVPALTALLCFHTARSLNGRWFLEWQYDQNTKAAVDRIRENAETSDITSGCLSISCNWLFEPSIRYYVRKEPIRYVERAGRRTVETNEDYVYIFCGDSVEIPDFTNKYALVHRFESTGTALFRKKLIDSTQQQITAPQVTVVEAPKHLE